MLSRWEPCGTNFSGRGSSFMRKLCKLMVSATLFMYSVTRLRETSWRIEVRISSGRLNEGNAETSVGKAGPIFLNSRFVPSQ